MTRLAYTVRKTLWFWFVVREWTWPQTHWQKYGGLRRWLAANGGRGQ